MNKETIIIWVMLILVTMSFAGCLEEKEGGSNDDDNDLSNYNFSLILDFDKIDLISNESINIKLTLINNGPESIELDTYQIVFPGINITNPEGKTYVLFHGNITVAPEYKILDEGDTIKTDLDLTNFFYFETSSNSWSTYPINWSILGKYSCYGFAYELKSNIIEFEITDDDNILEEDFIVLTDGSAKQYFLNSKYVFWNDGTDVYIYDIDKKESEKFESPFGNKYISDIDDNYIVWEDNAIYLYEFDTKITITISESPNKDSYPITPRISGDLVVWAEVMPDSADKDEWLLYSYSISNKQKEVLSSKIIDFEGLYLANNNVVFESNNTILILNIKNGSLHSVNVDNITSFDLSNNNLLLEQTIYDPPEGGLHIGDGSTWDIYFYLYDINNRTYKKIVDKEKYRARPEMYGDYIVWMGDHTFEAGLIGKVEKDWEIFLYDLSTNKEEQITLTIAGEYGPFIYGDNIIWREWDIEKDEYRLILHIISKK